VARGDGKKIDSYHYRYQGQTFKVSIYMVKDDEGTKFAAKCPEAPAQVGYGSDRLTVDEVKEQIEEKIRELVSVDWKDYFYLTISGRIAGIPDGIPETGESSYQAGTECGLKVQAVQLAETPQGKRHRFHKKSSYSETDASHIGWPDVGVERPLHAWNWQPAGTEPIRTLIPASPENRAALEQVIELFRRLNAAMRKFLSQEQIDGTVANILAGRGLLALGPAPEKGAVA
jgi:hypothetical protein